MSNNSIPISTRWLLDAVCEIGRSTINSIYLIVCPKTNSKGTGFLIKNGDLITNWHVIKDCNATEVFALSCDGEEISFQNIISDENRDLAVLKPTKQLGKGLELTEQNVEVGTNVSTWGHPLVQRFQNNTATFI